MIITRMVSLGLVPVLLSALSGLMLTASLPNVQWHWMAWIALLPLFLAIRGKTGREAFRLGYICGLSHFLSALYWIHYVIQHYGGLPTFLAVGALFLAAGYLAVYPALFAWAASRLEEMPALWTLALPSVWVALELVRAHAVTGFPWANLGYSQTPVLSLVQTADIAGVYGVSWLVVFGSTVLWSTMTRKTGWSAAVLFGICFGLCFAYGQQRLKTVTELQEKASPWRVSVIQGNIDQSRKWDPAFQQETLRRYRDLSLQAVAQDPPPDLLVWPETATPFFYGVDEKLTRQVNEILAEVGRPVVFGSPAITRVDGVPKLQNRAYLVTPDGKIAGSYAKQHLVPFGEYVPFQRLLFFIHRLVEAAGDFVPGNSSVPMAFGKKALGALICYEAVFPELARETALAGAEALVNITNDAWYGRTSAPYQHMEMAGWRAVECRVPLLRAANTGISTIFDATGRMCGAVPLFETGQLTCTVRSFRLVTVYMRYGDWFAWSCASIAVAALVFAFVRGRRRRSVA
ncbi:MAG: apolipoprotein N-acyltransferase [Syntrophobacteraceae bacterium]